MDINRVAELAGVSRATVSRYLNDGYVSAEKRAAIRRVIQQTGYIPSQQAKSLRTGKTDVVGVIIPKINSASVARIVAGITSVLRETGHQILLANTDNDAAREVASLRLFAGRNRVDGVILVATVFTEAHREAVDELAVPIVMVDQAIPGYSCVYQDDFGAVHDVAALALANAARPAYVGVFEEDASAGRDRRKGFEAACAEAGIAPEGCPQLVADFTVEAGYAAAERLLAEEQAVDTIVCATDAIACGAMICLREHGVDVPGDIQVTGVGDSELSQIVAPRLTTVHHHYKTSGIEAARMLAACLERPDGVPRAMKMGYEVVRRASTR